MPGFVYKKMEISARRMLLAEILLFLERKKGLARSVIKRYVQGPFFVKGSDPATVTKAGSL